MTEGQEECRWCRNTRRVIVRGAVNSLAAICFSEGIAYHGYWDEPSGPATIANYEYLAHLPHTHTEYDSNWVSATGMAIYESSSRPYWHGTKFDISTSGPVKKT